VASTRSALRASFHASYAEGAAAELFGACAGGAVLTAWALHLGASPFTIGLLGALPLAAQVLQLPGAWLTQSFGPKPVAITAIGASRLLWLPMVALPFTDVSAEMALRIFVGVVALAALFGVIGNNAWVVWMGDLVPSAIRGRFFSRRTMYRARRPEPAGMEGADARRAGRGRLPRRRPEPVPPASSARSGSRAPA